MKLLALSNFRILLRIGVKKSDVTRPILLKLIKPKYMTINSLYSTF